ncbi:hypothetical protein LEP1GSC060_1403 [Leptospira weilii serovar Ranarum str. ICFT]|uniref:Uncharacterized protein n=1 Tax=Leptospira weilii serovar Ranarum str. ICFT TaxID=1218598 RepID=N1WH08_9LEPT|nr:hypothetical protein LEP1GSC060_1403 [Leptospira weilii serovar Ranarum str. ICFT]
MNHLGLESPVADNVGLKSSRNLPFFSRRFSFLKTAYWFGLQSYKLGSDAFGDGIVVQKQFRFTI